MPGLCQLTTQDLWFWMINQQWPWFAFREFLFEMYLDLDILLQVDLYRKNCHQRLQALWGRLHVIIKFQSHEAGANLPHKSSKHDCLWAPPSSSNLSSLPFSPILCKRHIDFLWIGSFSNLKVMYVKQFIYLQCETLGSHKCWAPRHSKTQTVYKSHIKSSINFSIAFDYF